MEAFVRRFIRSSLVWLGVGVFIGVCMAILPGAAVHRTAHMHANLLGFVSMMIFGVAYHVMPRFAGNPLWSRRLAGVHLVLANVGLALLLAGWTSRVFLPVVARPALASGALLSAAGAILFIVNIWRTLEPAQALRTSARPERALRVLDERVTGSPLAPRGASAKGG